MNSYNLIFLSFGLLFNLISCSHHDDQRYTVKVKNAFGLRDEDGLWNESDSYCKVYGFALDGVTVYQTDTKDGNADPEWMESFVFRDDEGKGEYTGWQFRFYDEDPVSSDDFLGETTEIDVDDIDHCDYWYHYTLGVMYDNTQHGTFFVSIKKDC